MAMKPAFAHGLKILTLTCLVAMLPLRGASAQEDLSLELRQLRAEVDFLRDQVETGGGVADVRFEDLQRRIDKVLEDAAALATKASTAQRRAQTAVRRVEELEDRVQVLESAIDTLSTRLARLEDDAVFGETPAVASVKTDENGLPLPKDRSVAEPPTREFSSEVAVGDTQAEVLPVPIDPNPTLVPVSGATPLEGPLPVLPNVRPEAPVRRLPGAEDVAAAAADPEPAPAPSEPDPTPLPVPANFTQAKLEFVAGDFGKAAEGLQDLIDAGTLGGDEAEGYFLAGSAHYEVENYEASILALAQGLRRHPRSPFAAQSLVVLSDSLFKNGQKDESCRLLAFVGVDYPEATETVQLASERQQSNGC